MPPKKDLDKHLDQDMRDLIEEYIWECFHDCKARPENLEPRTVTIVFGFTPTTDQQDAEALVKQETEGSVALPQPKP